MGAPSFALAGARGSEAGEPHDRGEHLVRRGLAVDDLDPLALRGQLGDRRLIAGGDLLLHADVLEQLLHPAGGDPALRRDLGRTSRKSVRSGRRARAFSVAIQSRSAPVPWYASDEWYQRSETTVAPAASCTSTSRWR